MIDFGALPPEVNSGRMYAGPGAGSMLAAAAGWNGLAAELESAAGPAYIRAELNSGGNAPKSITLKPLRSQRHWAALAASAAAYEAALAPRVATNSSCIAVASALSSWYKAP